MARDISRFLHSLFWPAVRKFQQMHWQPSADVYRTRTGWLVKFDLAGVRPEDVEVEVEGSLLTVRGTRRDSLTEEGCSCYRMEISYSHFERSLELPCDLRHARVTAESRDGMLLVSIRTEDDK